MYIYISNSSLHCIKSGFAAPGDVIGFSVLVPKYFLLHSKLLVYNQYMSFQHCETPWLNLICSTHFFSYVVVAISLVSLCIG